MSDVAPWLTDYSNYSAAGGAFEGFAKALTDAQDRAMKRQEFQARLGAMQTQMQREQDQTDLEMMKTGAIRDGGTIKQGPASAEQRVNFLHQNAQAGTRVTGYDENGFPTGEEFDPNSAKAVHEKNIADKNAAMIGLAVRGQDRQDKRLDLQKQRLDVNSQFKANSQYHSELGDIENQMLQSNKALAIINKLQAADPNDPNAIKSSKQLAGDLSASLASTLNQGKPATVFGMQQQEFDSAWGRLQHGLQFLSGETRNSITPNMLTQLKIDLQAVNGEIGRQHEAKYQSMAEGIDPAYRSGIDNRYHKFRQGMGIENVQEQAPQEPANGLVGRKQGLIAPGLVAPGQSGAAQDPVLQKAVSMTPEQRAARIKELEAKAKQ